MFSSVLPWYLNLLFLGWLAWPLLFRICTRLHDRGYGLARAVGLILTTYLAWLLGNTALAHASPPPLPFGYGSVLLSAGLIGVVSLVSFLTERAAIITFVRRNLRLIIFYEVLCLTAFTAMLVLRSFVPHISYHATEYALHPLQDFAAEKFTDFAILNGLLASTSFPPQDAWLAGATMNYYYFGHLMWASVVKLTGVLPEIGYNLALASILALVTVQAASIAYNLTRRIRWGLLAAFLVAVAGNLDGFLQLFGIAKLILADAGSDGLPSIGGWAAWFLNYDFWRSSRAVENTITEFPAFSFVLGDLHAHLSGLVILLAGLGLLVQMTRSARCYPSLLRYELDCWDELFLAALLIGAMSAANSWDALTFAGVAACVLWATRLRHRPETDEQSPANREPVGARLYAGAEVFLLVAVLVIVGAKGFFFAYGRFFEPPFPPLLVSVQAAGIRVERLPQGFDAEETTILATRTDALIRAGRGMPEFRLLQSARWSVDVGLDYLPPSAEVIRGPLRPLRTTARTSMVEFVSHWLLLMLLPAILTASLLRRGYRRQVYARPTVPGGTPAVGMERQPSPGVSRQRFWALAAVGLAIAVVLYPLLQGWVACLGILAIFALVAALAGFWQPPAVRTFLALMLAFITLGVFCELLYLDDIFEVPIERINTVFKVYYGMWQVAAIATVLAVSRLVRYTPRSQRRRRALALVLPLLLIGGAYMVMAPVQRTLAATRLGHPDRSYEDIPAESLLPHMRPEARAQTVEQALDGLRYLQFIHPDDYAAIRWMRRNVPPDAHILEAAGTQYEYSGRFSATTGRPALAGWLMHEYGWRGTRFIPDRERRTTITQEIYTTRNPFKALALLAGDQIEYVIVGDEERRKYPALAPEAMTEVKFRAIGTVVFEKGDTTIYRINLPGDQGMAIDIPPGALTEIEEPEDTTTPAAIADESPVPDVIPDPVIPAEALTTDSLIEALTRSAAPPVPPAVDDEAATTGLLPSELTTTTW